MRITLSRSANVTYNSYLFNKWLNHWHVDANLRNKFGGAFAIAGGIHAGADGAIMSILRSMMVFQMIAVGGDSWTSPKAYALGERIANITTAWKNSSYVNDWN